MAREKGAEEGGQLTFHRLLGGRRKGGGRKKSPDSGVPHLRRPVVKRRHPVHVTLKVLPGLPSLRLQRCAGAVIEALRRGCRGTVREPGGMRLCHFSLQFDHGHLIVEVEDGGALARGVQGLCVRIAKGLNKLLGRKGPVFADRYHAHVLETPGEVRNALAYVFRNWKKHGVKGGELGRPDELSSGRWFGGWRDYAAEAIQEAAGCSPVVEARTWLLSVGWARAGPLVLAEVHA